MNTASTSIEPPKANKTDAGNGSNGICRVSNVLRSPSPDPGRSSHSSLTVMNRILLLISSTVILSATASGADWADLKKNAAKIEVLNMKPVPFAVSDGKDGWAAIPPELDKQETRVFMPTYGTNPVSDIKVIEDGWIIVACNYGYQGNASGNWQSEVWSEAKFKAKGWHPLSKKELGGLLIRNNNKVEIVFAKKFKKGDTMRLRCNKYDPPFPIVLELKP